MPEKNRDKESLYPPGKLSLWFLATSGLLFASLVWMVGADHFDHPWRTIQSDFYKKQSEILKAKREEAEKGVRDVGNSKRLVELGNKLRASNKAMDENPEVQSLKSRLAALTLDIADWDRKIKAVKGDFSAAKFDLEMGQKNRREGRASDDEVARLAKVFQDLGETQAGYESSKSIPVADKTAVELQLNALTADNKKLKKDWDAELEAVTKLETQVSVSVGKTEENQWRNAPGIDFLAPTIKIEKVVCENIHDDFNFATSPKVDMCMTCHMGIDKALFAEKETMEKFHVALVHRAHPALEVMVGSTSPHPKESFGCTVCHAGRGWSTDFTRASHTPDGDEQEHAWKREQGWHEPEYIDFPMLPMKYAEGQCLKCHMQGLYYKPGNVTDEPLKEGGRSTPTWKPGFEILRREEQKPDDWFVAAKKAPKPQDDMTAVAGAPWHPRKLEHAMKTVREWGCTGCHLIKSAMPTAGNVFLAATPGYPRPASDVEAADFSVAAVGTLSPVDMIRETKTVLGIPKVGWDLSHVADKLDLTFIRKWMRNTTSFRIDTRMPNFYNHRLHNDEYQWVGADGKTVLPPGAPPVDKAVIVTADGDEEGKAYAKRLADVEIEAISAYLVWISKQDRKGQYPQPPAGDAKRGAKTFYSVGCFGCHLSKGEKWDDKRNDWEGDDGARFLVSDPEHPGEKRMENLPPGPRLTAMGSKTTAAWLYEWLREPRHYWSTTRMPNMRWRDLLGDDNKTVVRTADQIRADVVAYLIEMKDDAFDKAEIRTQKDWTPKHYEVLKDMWLEYFGKGKSAAAADGEYENKPPEGKPEDRGAIDPTDEKHRKPDFLKMGRLESVGMKLVGQRGCFGCHNIPGYEESQPIGKDLSAEGSQDLHKFDFGLLSEPLSHDVPHTRWGWIHQKLVEPRIYDKGRIKLWTEKLRMPKFNFREEDREAVTALVLGLVKEPIKEPAIFRPNALQKAILDGRAVIARYNCTQCHNIEGKKGVLWAAQSAKQIESWMLPPNLFGEGNRVRPEWLFKFLKDPDSVSPYHYLRPGVIQRMPKFRLSDEEANALVSMFEALAGRKNTLSFDPADAPFDATPYAAPVTITVKVPDAAGNPSEKSLTVASAEEEAKALFDTFNCAKCHLPRGTPGADPNDGGQAPPFTLAGPRLRREWMVEMLKDPQTQIEGTKMVQFWEVKAQRGRKPGETRKVAFPEFEFALRGAHPGTDALTEEQIQNLARWILYHYPKTPAAPSGPPTPDPK